MARVKFTEESTAGVAYRGGRQPGVVVPDPLLHRHRLTVTATRKRFEI